MRRSVLLAVLANVVLLFPFGSFARDAAECLAAPNAASPRGSHWYYHFDRVNRRKCWYLGPEGQKTNPGASQVAAEERRALRSSSGLTTPPPPVAPMPGVVRQTESEQFAETTVGDALPREALSPAPLAQLKSPAPMDRAPAPTSKPDTPSAGDSQNATPPVESDPVPVETAVTQEPAAAPPPASPIHWGTLIVLVAGALGVAGFVGRTAFQDPGGLRLDQHARREQPLATFLRAWTRPRDQAAPDSAMSPPSPVPYLRAPNLAWLADEGLHQPDEPNWVEAPDVHAERWAEPDLRRARTG